MPLFEEAWVRRGLDQAEHAISEGRFDDIAPALASLPSELFLLLYFDRPQQWPNIAAWLPTLPSEANQKLWAGNTGLYLMHQGCLFIDDVFSRYGCASVDLKVLDYGFGWGRMLRLLYNRVRLSGIYGVDPWPLSFERAKDTNVHGRVGLVDYVPDRLPFGETFDIVFLFSVFTHVSERSQKAILKLLRAHIAPDGLLAITIRQANYWRGTAWPEESVRVELLQQHLSEGFAFISHGAKSDGHNTPDFGDTSQTIDYIKREWTDWRLEHVGWRMADEYQAVAFLRPA